MFFAHALRTRITDTLELHLMGPIKLRILQRFVESEGFFLGDHGNLLGASVGPLVICARQPDGHTRILATALRPGDAFDALDVLPSDPFTCTPHALPPINHPVFLSSTLSSMISNAVRAIDRLKRYQTTGPSTLRSMPRPN